MTSLKQQRIRDAQRAGTVNRLTGQGWPPDRAQAGVAAFEAWAAKVGRDRDATGYWDDAEAWLLDWRRRTR
jgi:hypothetical protein